jgi:hypothetical protein
MKYKIGDQVKVIDYRSEYLGELVDIKKIDTTDRPFYAEWGKYCAWFTESQLAPAHTLDALTPGDVVVDKNGLERNGLERKVLERLLQTVYLESIGGNFWAEIEWLKDLNYTLKNTPKETVEEVTVEELFDQPHVKHTLKLVPLSQRELFVSEMKNHITKAIGGVIKKS